MPRPSSDHPPLRSSARGAAALVALAGLLLVGLPALVVAWEVLARVRMDGAARGSSTQGLGSGWGLLAGSALAALAIALLATLLAWPVAWALRRGGAWLRVWLVVPVLMPAYLVYHALGVQRAPATRLGDWIESVSVVGGGWEWLPVFVGRFIAIVGLAVWAAPVAALVLGAGVASLDRGVLESLRTDGAGPLRRQCTCVLLCKGPIAWSVGLVFVLMLGSALPLHLANMPTLAVQAWLRIALAPDDARVWLSSWPILLGALLAGALVARQAWRALDSARPAHQRDTTRGHDARGWGPTGASVAAWVLIACGTLLPVVISALSVRNWAGVRTFARILTPALGDATLIALGVGLAGAALALATMRAAGSASPIVRAIVAVVLAIMLAAFFVPGTLMGQAWYLVVLLLQRAWPDIDAGGGGVAIVLACHLARFGALALLAGVFLASMEDPVARQLRRVDGAEGLWAWWWACARPALPTLVGVGLALACLSLHEVEATIVLQPPGTQSLAQTMLAQLHFARMDELASGTLLVVGSGMVLALLAGPVAWWWGAGRRR